MYNTSGINKNSEDNTDEDDTMVLYRYEVDNMPSPKERHSQIMTRMYQYLHDIDWNGFDSYWLKCQELYKHNSDIQALLAIYRVDRLKNSGDYDSAEAMLPDVERKLQQSSSPQSLTTRYLATKSYILHFRGQQDEAASLQKQAMQMGANQKSCMSTAYNLTMYALNGCLHQVNENGESIIPTEADWRKARKFFETGCEQHLIWTRDLEDASKIPEGVISSFFLFAFVRQIFTLVKSCPASGFVYFEKHSCSADELLTASHCIDRVNRNIDILSTRINMEFNLVYCDYFLRQAQHDPDQKQAMLKEAMHFTLKALYLAITIKDKPYAKFNEEAIKQRISYIQGQNISLLLTKKLIQDSQEQFSHLDPFKIKDRAVPKDCKDDSRIIGESYSAADEAANKRQLEDAITHHFASCPECAYRQTSPKEIASELFDLVDPTLTVSKHV